MKRLEGKVALITGAGQGVGFGIAQAFVEQGAALMRGQLKRRREGGENVRHAEPRQQRVGDGVSLQSGEGIEHRTQAWLLPGVLVQHLSEYRRDHRLLHRGGGGFQLLQ